MDVLGDDTSSEEEIDMLVQCNMDAIAAVVAKTRDNQPKSLGEWRHLPRGTKMQYDHSRALKCVQEDYLGSVPRFDWEEFITMFRVSRARFQTFLEDFAEDPFYKPSFDAFGKLQFPLR